MGPANVTVLFRDSAGRELGKVDLLPALVSLTLFFSAVVFALAPIVNINRLALALLTYVSDDPQWFALSRPIAQAVRVLAVVSSAATAWYGYKRIGSAMVAAIWHTFSGRALSDDKLLREKLATEAMSFPLSYQSAFDWEVACARSDASVLKRAAEYGLVDNSEIWPCDSHFFHEYPQEVPDVRRAAADASLRGAALAAARDALSRAATGLAEGEEEEVVFYVSPIQPAVLLAALQVEEDAKNCGVPIRVLDGTSTGPETVKEARVKLARDRRGTRRVLFVAPLSAFLMAPRTVAQTVGADIDQAGQADCRLRCPPNTLFIPFCTVARERQDVLIVEGGSRLPLRKGTLYYYDNSTAEEFVAHLNLADLDLVSVKPVTDYGKYKRMLQGTSRSIQLQPGDGMVSWPPLTGAFRGRPVGTGHFRLAVFDSAPRVDSRIMLFVDRRCVESPLEPISGLAWAFVDYLLKILAMMREERKSGSVTGLTPILGSRHIKKYAPLYSAEGE